MIPEQAFNRLMGLGQCWEVANAEYETEPEERFLLIIRETEVLWPGLRCPVPTCGCTKVVCHDHAQPRTWRHLDAFGKRTEILCARPRARCGRCGKVWSVPLPWEGLSRHFTGDFEAFTLTLMREMPVSKVGEIVGEHDTRLWRILFAHVEAAYDKLDLSDLVHVGVDEMNCRKGHNYLTVFADLMQRRVIFATEGKDHTTLERFAAEILRHNGHPKAITEVALDMSKSYQKGVAENLANARLSFDPFHVSALVSKAVDQVRIKEAQEGEDAARAQLKKSLWLFRTNPENLTAKQEARLEQLDLKHMATGQAYLMRLELRDIYQKTRTEEKARFRLTSWLNWVRGKCNRLGEWLEPMRKVAATIEKHLDGILGYWSNGLNTSYLEALNSVFSAVKRKARGYRSSEYMITMLYFVAGKLDVPTLCSHSK